MSRFSRNEALFGAEGQRFLGAVRVAIVGLGGLGSAVGQQLAHLGVSDLGLIEFDHVTSSSLNRLIGAHSIDVKTRTAKLAVAERTIKAIAPEARIQCFDGRIGDPGSGDFLARADWVLGCLDEDVARLELLGMASEQGLPYFDLASDIVGEGEERVYGGRVVLSRGQGCLVCLPELLDQTAIAKARLDPAGRDAHRRIYGVDADALDSTGPSVVSVNGVVASLGVTELMVAVTGLREPFMQLTYRGERGSVTRSRDEGEHDCLYCSTFRGAR
jgi:hypothetical protein